MLKNTKLDNWILNTSKVHAVGFWDKTKRQNEKNDNRRKETKDKKTKQKINKKAKQQKRLKEKKCRQFLTIVCILAPYVNHGEINFLPKITAT